MTLQDMLDHARALRKNNQHTMTSSPCTVIDAIETGFAHVERLRALLERALGELRNIRWPNGKECQKDCRVCRAEELLARGIDAVHPLAKQMLVAAASTGHEGTIRLAAQLAGVSPCPVCGFAKQHCRCAEPRVGMKVKWPVDRGYGAETGHGSIIGHMENGHWAVKTWNDVVLGLPDDWEVE